MNNNPFQMNALVTQEIFTFHLLNVTPNLLPNRKPTLNNTESQHLLKLKDMKIFLARFHICHVTSHISKC